MRRQVQHPLYKKIIKRNKKFHAHDENNSLNIGEIVSIILFISHSTSVPTSNFSSKQVTFKNPSELLLMRIQRELTLIQEFVLTHLSQLLNPREDRD